MQQQHKGCQTEKVQLPDDSQGTAAVQQLYKTPHV